MKRNELTQLLRDRSFTTLRAAIALASSIPAENGGNKEAATDAIQSMELAALALNDILPGEEDREELGDVIDPRAEAFESLVRPLIYPEEMPPDVRGKFARHRRERIQQAMPFLTGPEQVRVREWLGQNANVPENFCPQT